MKIGAREIGTGHPPYVIAEIGVNHDGSRDRALELTRLAAEAGADAVKFQLFEADRLMSRAAKLAAYQKAAGESDPVEMLRRLELSIDDLAPCVGEAHRLGVHAIVSVFSVELVPVAERLPWDAYKSASPDIINKPLLDAMAATGKPLIVSTGASTLEEVVRAVEWLAPIHDRLALLQCVSCYPTEESDAELGGIAVLRSMFDGPVGYSDHTRSERMSSLAVGAGACVLEKHFTDDRTRRGPDHAASLEPAMMSRYVSAGASPRRLPIHSEKRVLGIEQDVRTVSRQSLVAKRELPAGTVISGGDLTIKRPGTGLPPYELDRVVGATLLAPLESDMPLRPFHLRLNQEASA
ncbi:N-acetylneuraminate synthase [Phycisphaerales bacterium]|nr:N-acetylneuraminate synthase [Phycisphaerales bacterium]